MHNSFNNVALESLESVTIDSKKQQDFFKINEKEFYFKGCLYDIKYKIVVDDKIIYRCKKDEKEYELISQFIRIHDENNESGRKIPLSKFMQKAYQNLYFQKLTNYGLLFSSYQVYNIASSSLYNQPDLYQFTPPPQIFNT